MQTSTRVIVATAATLLWAAGPADSQPTPPSTGPKDGDVCASIADPAVRARCVETLNAFGKPSPVERTSLPGGWQLVRTPTPQGGVGTVTISHSADLLGSDPNLAGLILQCSEKKIEILIVVLEAYPQAGSIDVTLKIGPSAASKYRGDVVQPGMMVRLPGTAASAVFDAVGRSDKVSVSLADSPTRATNGSINITELGSALKTLRESCILR